MSSIDFYFDYSSPYGYLASTQIETLAEKHGRTVNWRPILLGAIFKVSGQGPLTSFPLKGDYAMMDFARSARELKVPYQHPSTFPIGGVAPARATYWTSENGDAAVASKTGELVKSLLKAYFVEDRNINDAAVVLDVAGSIGLDPTELEAGMTNQAIKDFLKGEVDNAIKRGVFGSPMMYVDDQAFWGSDRLDQLDRWLTRGGW